MIPLGNTYQRTGEMAIQTIREEKEAGNVHVGCIHHRWSNRGGAEKYLKALVEYLVSRGVHVSLFVNRIELDVPPEVTLVKVPMVRYPLWLRYLTFPIFVHHYLKKFPVDCSIGFGKVWGCDIIRLSGGCHRAYEKRMEAVHTQISGAPSFLRRWYRKVSPYQMTQRYIEDRMFSDNSTFVAVSELVKRDVLHYYPHFLQPVIVIPNGRERQQLKGPLDAAEKSVLRKKLGLREQGLMMLSVATNPLLKGALTILKMLRDLPDSFKKQYRPFCIFIGLSRSRSLQKLIRKYDCEGCVTIIPFTETLADYYRASDILLHPTYYDAFANVCLEANAMALPVLTSTANGGSSIYTHNSNGLLLSDATDYREMAAIIVSTVQEGRLESIGQAGYELLAEYSWKNNLDTFYSLLLSKCQLKGESGFDVKEHQ